MSAVRSEAGDKEDDDDSSLTGIEGFLTNSGSRRRRCRLPVLQEQERQYYHPGDSEIDQERLAQASLLHSRQAESNARRLGSLQAIEIMNAAATRPESQGVSSSQTFHTQIVAHDEVHERLRQLKGSSSRVGFVEQARSTLYYSIE